MKFFNPIESGKGIREGLFEFAIAAIVIACTAEGIAALQTLPMPV